MKWIRLVPRYMLSHTICSASEVPPDRAHSSSSRERVLFIIIDDDDGTITQSRAHNEDRSVRDGGPRVVDEDGRVHVAIDG